MSARSRLLSLSLFLLLILSAIWLDLPRLRAVPLRGGSLSVNLPSKPLKILVSSAGVYQLTNQQLERAGWSLIDPARVQLESRGQPRPLWIERQGQDFVLRFYAQAAESPYTDQNVYWLYSQGGEGVSEFGQAQSPRSAETSSAPRETTLATLFLEENHLYQPLVEQGDHWLWQSLTAPQTRDFDFRLASLAAGPAGLLLEVWGSTEAPLSPDHHLRLALNEQWVAEYSWDGRGNHTLRADIPDGVLRDGFNTLTIQAVGDTGAVADIVFVDRLTLEYPRQLLAAADRLEFDGQGDAVALRGFTGNVAVFDLTDPWIARPMGIFPAMGGSLVYEGEAGHRYLALGPEGYLSPMAVLSPALQPNLRAPALGADYLAIAPLDLLTPLQPLLAWRESQGLRVMAIPLEAVYDQFNAGLPEPEAVRAFLRHAVDHWNPAPRFVLLVGDATYDPLGYRSSPQANRLPSFLVNTEFGGQTTSDVLFAQLDEDLLPDIAIGRLPAQNAGQLRALVGKILTYEGEPSASEWSGRILAIADGQDPMFRREAQSFLDRFSDQPVSSDQLELFAPPADSQDAAAQVVGRLQNGARLVAYFGHGSLTMWGKDRLFSVADVASLSGHPPIPLMLHMTCLTGLFTHPEVESLAEALLWQPDGGALAVLAPTSLTLSGDQSFLYQAFVEALLADPTAPIGQVLLAAQRKMPVQSAGAMDVMLTFMLLGDPALTLHSP